MKNNAVKRWINVVLLGALSLMVQGCQSSCNQSTEDLGIKKLSETVAARVNGVEILLSELNTLHERSIEKFKKTGQPVNANMERQLRGSLLRRMIDDEIVRQKATALDIKVDRFERVDALELYKARMGGEKGFEVFLEKQNFTEDQLIETIVKEKLREKLVEKMNKKPEITEEEIDKHYHANLQLYTQPEMVRARHILIKLAKDDPKEKKELALKKANKVLEEAKKPGRPFENLVQMYGEGPSVQNGGDLGFFPRGRMVAAFDAAAFSAPVKTPVGPILTDYGYHIIYVEEKTPMKPSPLAAVRNRVVELLGKNKRSLVIEALLNDLKKSADIKIDDYSMTQEEYTKYETREASNVKD